MNVGKWAVPKAEDRAELGRVPGKIRQMGCDGRIFFFEGDPEDQWHETSRYELACPHKQPADECPACAIYLANLARYHGHQTDRA
jgi:hypothetical protein